MNPSITQQFAHWLISLGMDPALSVLFSMVALIGVPLMVAVAIAAVVEIRAAKRFRLSSGPVFTGLHKTAFTTK